MGRDTLVTHAEAAPGVSSSMLGAWSAPTLDLQEHDQLEAAELPLLRMMEACAACLLNDWDAPVPTEPEWGQVPLSPPQSCAADKAELAGRFCI